MVRTLLFLVCFLLIFINGCTEDFTVQDSILPASDAQFIIFDAGTDYGNDSTFDVVTAPHDDLFAKWQKYNEQEMRQDEWDAVMGIDGNDGDGDDDGNLNETVRRGSGVPLRDY